MLLLVLLVHPLCCCNHAPTPGVWLTLASLLISATQLRSSAHAAARAASARACSSLRAPNRSCRRPISSGAAAASGAPLSPAAAPEAASCARSVATSASRCASCSCRVLMWVSRWASWFLRSASSRRSASCFGASVGVAEPGVAGPGAGVKNVSAQIHHGNFFSVWRIVCVPSAAACAGASLAGVTSGDGTSVNSSRGVSGLLSSPALLFLRDRGLPFLPIL